VAPQKRRVLCLSGSLFLSNTHTNTHTHTHTHTHTLAHARALSLSLSESVRKWCAHTDSQKHTQIGGDNPFTWKDVTTKDIFKGKRVVVFSLPGAFTPTCSSTHLPGYESKYEEIKACGMHFVCVVCVCVCVCVCMCLCVCVCVVVCLSVCAGGLAGEQSYCLQVSQRCLCLSHSQTHPQTIEHTHPHTHSVYVQA
jgi:hypothetical protein